MDLVQEVQKTYGYSQELVEVLNRIVPAMKEYYGKDAEAFIDDAIRSCEIHIKGEKENEEMFLQEFFDDEGVTKSPIQAAAYYASKLVETEDGLKPKRLIYIKNGKDLQTDQQIAKLVHEMCHLVKGYQNEFTIEGDYIIKKTGIGRETYQRDETGRTTKTQSENDGIEEALNIYDEEQITSQILGREYISSNYSAMAEVTREIMKNPKYKDAFKRATLTGDKRDLIGISKSEFDRIDELYNNIYATYFPTWKEVKTKEGRERIKTKRRGNIEAIRQQASKEDKSDGFLASLQGLVKEQIDLDSKIVQETTDRSIDAI